MQTIARGVWSGIFATSAMSLYMMQQHEKLTTAKKSPLPPATLTSQMTRMVGIDQMLPQSQRENATLLSHFGYGVAAALLYSLAQGENSSFSFLQKKENGILKGLTYGAGVWAFSYLVLTPSLGMRASAQKMPKERNGMMLLAHLIWGGVLGYTEKEFRAAGPQLLDGRKKSWLAE